jgi:hypothetical protein
MGEIMEKYWQLILFGVTVIWSHVENHFKIKRLEERNDYNEKKIDHIQKEIKSELKEMMVENKKSVNELSHVVSELNSTSKILAKEIEWMQRKSDQ